MSQTNIEQLVSCFVASNTEGVNEQEIQAFINEWYNSSATRVYDCTLIIMQNPPEKAISQALFCMKNLIYNCWNQEEAFHSEIISNLCSFLFSGAEISPQTYQVCVECVARIGAFTIMDEWTDFWSNCLFDSSEENIIIRSMKLNLTAEFCREVEECPNLTENTRALVKKANQEQIGALIECVHLGIENEVTLPYAIKCLNYVIKMSETMDFLTDDIVQALLLHYMVDINTQKYAIDCLNTIFITKNNINFLRHYSAIVVYAMINGKDPENPSVRVTNNRDVVEFLSAFMKKFIFIIDTVFFPPPEGTDPVIAQRMTEEAEMILQGLQQYNVSKEEFAQQILELYRIILSVDENSISNAFWSLWSTVVNKMFVEVSSKGTGPVFEFFSEMFPSIRETVFNMLPTAIDDECVLNYEARSIWILLMKIDTEGMIEFLQEKDMSQSFLLSCSMIECLTQSDTTDLIKTIIAFIDDVDGETDEDVVVSLIFAVSHFTEFLSTDKDSLVKVVEFLIQCIQMDGKIPISASHAILYIVKCNINSLIEDDMEIAKAIIEASESFLECLSDENKIRMFTVCATLISYEKNPENVMQLYVQLFEPIKNALDVFNGDPANRENMDGAIIALDIIKECSKNVKVNGGALCSLFAPILIELAPNIFGEDLFYDVSVSLMDSLAHLMCLSTYEEIEGIINATLSSIIGHREQVTSVFPFLRKLRKSFVQLDAQFAQYKETFIDPALTTEDPPLEDILLMLKEFDFTVIPPEFSLQIFIAGIENLTSDVNKAAIEFWLSSLSTLWKLNQDPASKAQVLSILQNTTPDVLRVCLSAIGDMIHNSVQKELIELIRNLFNTLGNAGLLTSVVELVNETLTTIFGAEKSEGFYTEFVNFLIAEKVSQAKFFIAFNNFLSNVHNYSCLDSEIFKVIEKTNFSFAPVASNKQSLLGQLKNEGTTIKPMKLVLGPLGRNRRRGGIRSVTLIKK